jgi:hypothetical protein
LIIAQRRSPSIELVHTPRRTGKPSKLEVKEEVSYFFCQLKVFVPVTYSVAIVDHAFTYMVEESQI